MVWTSPLFGLFLAAGTGEWQILESNFKAFDLDIRAVLTCDLTIKDILDGASVAILLKNDRLAFLALTSIALGLSRQGLATIALHGVPERYRGYVFTLEPSFFQDLGLMMRWHMDDILGKALRKQPDSTGLF